MSLTVKYGIGVGVPAILRVVDNALGDALVYNATHHLVDNALLGKSCITLVVVGLQLVAQTPVGDECHIGEEAVPLIIAQLPHHDIVVGYVVVGSSQLVGQLLVGRSRHTRGEEVAKAGVSPLAAAPLGSHAVLLIEGVEGEVECHNESYLLQVHVVVEMSGGVEAAKHLVEFSGFGSHYMERQFEVDADFVETAPEAFKVGLKGLGHAPQGRRISLEVFKTENTEIVGGAVVGSPEGCHLGHTAPGTVHNVVAILLMQGVEGCLKGVGVDIAHGCGLVFMATGDRQGQQGAKDDNQWRGTPAGDIFVENFGE